ncbi:dbeea0d6-1fc2-480d-83de-0d180f986e3f-CDS [Sclerotinia trifoliorum]|uniref:Dbeea0d6-1fc2-480d-83de-0d180f986e3f-CDS n=1 Tax=Sclerotinia trifoliorum TaxID=28548 RepID=A0A8H2VZ61_9HELO|nr:dbeea0d6-1fc2-480d-83de-0d180f986e3f-CDS [Sclerotinia trifoliorum]
MAEVLGTALSIVGAVGVLGQIFSGCITAYSLFTTASNLTRDSEKLICKIKIEEMRLLVWGREWGVLEGRFEEELKREEGIGNERMRGLAMEILSELYRTMTDFQKLRERYGVVEERSGRDEIEGRENGERGAEIEKGGFGLGKLSLRSELSKRVKWVIGDKEKFTVLLQDLKDYNDGLEQLFPPSRLATLHRTWTNELLQGAHRDLGKLKMLETASSGVYPALNVSANLKQLRINLDEKETKNFKPTYTLKIQRHALVVKNANMARIHGQYKNSSLVESQEIIVEWVEYDREDLDARLNHLRRIDDLARMIHSASDRHPDLHTIDCLGYTDDSTSSRYGLIYHSPSSASSSSTLNALITSSDFRTPDLGDRFKLAHTLSVALWSLHSLDWLHKNLCSSNILFFPSAYTKSPGISKERDNVPNISTPYLLGFDASRPDHMGEMSIASRNPTAADLHRHPLSLHSPSCPRKQYCKSFDIYSLGLILLEIGLWKTLQMYHKPHYSAERFRDKIVVQNLVPGLGSKVGRGYKEVVERCLAVKEDLTGVEAGVLMEFVVGRLEGLRV